MIVSILETLLEFAALGVVLLTAVFAVQIGAAALLRDRPFSLAPHRPSLAVLIPAHNEEQGLEATLLRIKEDLSPIDRLLVVADNCIDRTAQLAARAGAEVVIRNDPDRRGKGYALAAGLDHLAAMPPEVVVFIDADCQISSRGVELLARACAAASTPIQCLNLMVASPDSRAPPRLAEFAWRIKNDLRPSGYARLGLPCHLLGTGMALPWGLIKPELFATGHLAEDMLLGLELAIEGRPPRFFRSARVTSYFPDTDGGRDQQKQRWLHGHFGLIARYAPRLLYWGLRRREPGLLALAADLAIPPLAVLAFANMMLLAMSLACMTATGAIAPFALAALGSALLVSSLLTAWSVCGHDLIGRKEIVTQLPAHIMMVLRSALNLARGRKVPWIRADRFQATTPFKRRPRG